MIRNGKTITSEKFTGEQIAKRFFFLAYNAAGPAGGMGVFQARRNVTEDDVWKNVNTAGDYPDPAATK